MPLKLHYFDGRGIGEPIRWILHYSGVEFEDARIPFDKFPPTLPQEIKSMGRWGQVPIAELEDGKTLTQSMAIARYFAKKGNLVPENDYEAALCDEYVDAVRDMMVALWPVYMISDPKEKEEKLKESLKMNRAKYLDVLESIIKANGGQHLVGNSLTWSDIILAYVLDHFQILLDVDLTEGYPTIKNLKDSTMNQPKIKEWLEERPKTSL